MVKSSGSTDATKPRKGMPGTQLSKQDFKLRYGEQFTDPAFRAVQAEIDKIADIAWDAYDEPRKAPITEKAGTGFKNPITISLWIGPLHEMQLTPRSLSMTPRAARRASC
jgi:hypothetical protein